MKKEIEKFVNRIDKAIIISIYRNNVYHYGLTFIRIENENKFHVIAKIPGCSQPVGGVPKLIGTKGIMYFLGEEQKGYKIDKFEILKNSELKVERAEAAKLFLTTGV
jgi:hypothetical protein